MDKLVSIIIPVYNRAIAVLKAVASVQNQQYKNWEIILVDDGSESRRYQDKLKDSNIHIINNDKNRGVSYSRNVGLLNAKGEYIVFLDSDNTLEETYLKEMLECINCSGAEAVFSLWNYVYGEKKLNCLNHKSESLLIKALKPLALNEYTYTIGAHEFLEIAVLNDVNYTHINAVLVKRSCVGLFNEGLRVSEDTVWIYELLSKVKQINFIMKPLLNFISSSDSVYQYINRSEIIELSMLNKEQAKKLVHTISGSIISYKFLVISFEKRGVKYAPLVKAFRKIIKRKEYTSILIKEIFHEKITWYELKRQPIYFQIRYLLGLLPISLRQVDYCKIDIY